MDHRTRLGRMRRIVFALGAVITAGSCTDPMDLLRYEDRRPFTPPVATYTEWWRQVEACSGRVGDMGGIRWFLADLIGWGREGHLSPSVRGQWLSNRQITLRTGYEDAFEVVKHEMLHDLLRGDGEHRHEAWGVCDRNDGMPGVPGLPTGVYDYEVSWRMATVGPALNFVGTLTVHSADEGEVRVEWDVTTTSGDGTARFVGGVTKGYWDYDEYVIPAQVVDGPATAVTSRIARVDGAVRCLGASAADRVADCHVSGPR